MISEAHQGPQVKKVGGAGGSSRGQAMKWEQVSRSEPASRQAKVGGSGPQTGPVVAGGGWDGWEAAAEEDIRHELPNHPK